MKRLAILTFAALFSGCVAAGKRDVKDERQKLAMETRCYEAADVRREVEECVQRGDLRFKGWTQGIADSVTFLPGISADEGKTLEKLKLPDAEVLYIDDVFPVVADVRAYEKRTAALFDYMRRFNRALFEQLLSTGKIPHPPNQSPAPTPPAQSHQPARSAGEPHCARRGSPVTSRPK